MPRRREERMEKLKIAMIGDWDSVVGFKAIGAEAFVASSPEEGPELWESLPLERYAVVMVTEPVYDVLVERITDFAAHEGLPVVMAIPTVSGSLGLGKSMVKKRVVKALGSVLEG
ncbi:MAG: V-type ATP synthase subunit F [Actinobacteria bacterium]|nr:V-type ATP synthase subunit F [Actinomycetota bacterium]